MASERELRWTHQAERDLEEHHHRLSALDPEAARRFAASVLETVESLASFPGLGEVEHDLRPVGRYRSLACEGGRVIYRAEPEVVWILRIWIGRRDPRGLVPE